MSSEVAESRDIGAVFDYKHSNLAEDANLCSNVPETETMLVNALYASKSELCGICIFNRHLGSVLKPLGIHLVDTNLRYSRSVDAAPTSVLHYVPSAFADVDASRALVNTLASLRPPQQIVVILHGIHNLEEKRFLNDTPCTDQAIHVSLMLRKAKSIVALSEAVATTFRTWQSHFSLTARLVRLEHPGLFQPAAPAVSTESYAFIGGISRSKKNYTIGNLRALISLCERRGIKIWQHWTNVKEKPPSPSWRQTSGFLSDTQWSHLISGARVVLCPYQTRIQSVSGLISETLSAGRFVLATSFELALEMQHRFPEMLRVEDDLDRWPNAILRLPSSDPRGSSTVLTWNSFAESVALELRAPAPQESFSEAIPETAITADAPAIAQMPLFGDRSIHHQRL